MLRVLVVLMSLLGVMPAQQPVCSGTGLDLAVRGGRLGDPWEARILGAPPLAPGILGVSPSGMPSGTPFGTVCLGPLSGAALLPLLFDSSGTAILAGILPTGGVLTGSEVVLQAAAADAAVPGSVRLSQERRVAMRAPGSYVVGSSGAASTHVLFLDGLGDSATLIATLPGTYVGAIRIPAFGWIALHGSDVRCIDEVTGASVFTWAPPWCGANDQALAANGTGNGLLFLDIPSCGSGLPQPPVLTAADFTTGAAVITTLPVTGGLSGNRAVLPLPDTTVAYVRIAHKVLVVDHAASTLITTLDLYAMPGSGINDWFLWNGRLYTVASSGASGGTTIVHAIDTATHAVVAGPVTFPGYGAVIRAGPGPAGPGVFVLGAVPITGTTAPWTGLDPLTLSVLGMTVAPFPRALHIEPSASGTEWYFLNVPGFSQPEELYRMDAASQTFTQVGTFAPAMVTGLPGGVYSTRFLPLASATLSKLHVLDTPSSFIVIPTDPLGPASAPAPLPVTLQSPVLFVGND